MFREPSITLSIIRKLDPSVSDHHVKSLASVWDDVVDMIMKLMLSYDKTDAPLHINLRAEMAMFASQMVGYFSEEVVKARTIGRSVSDIDPIAERNECFSKEVDGGLKKIEDTAKLFYEKQWKPKMEDRWIPKAAKAIEKDKLPKKKVNLSVKKVNKKHYISEWIIRDYWASVDRVNRWKRDGSVWVSRSIPYGSWGYVSDLWSDRLESYFSLLEGDAKKPYEMLLRTVPLNPSQVESFVGFLVMHILRNPAFISYMCNYAKDDIEAGASKTGSDFHAVSKDSFEALFNKGEVYRAYAHPIFESQWSIVTSEIPVFVLPDTFCVRLHVEGVVRMLVPMSPNHCLITLAQPPVKNAIIPVHHRADEELALMISRLLIKGSDQQFLAHHDFTMPAMDGQPTSTLGEIIRVISEAIPDYYFRYGTS